MPNVPIAWLTTVKSYFRTKLKPQCWKWVYSVYTSDCLREGILQHYEEESGGGLEIKAEDCCLCCELKCELNFEISSLIVLLIKAIKELEQALRSSGVSESKLIP